MRPRHHASHLGTCPSRGVSRCGRATERGQDRFQMRAEQRPDLAGIGSFPQERAVEMAEAHRDGGDTGAGPPAAPGSPRAAPPPPPAVQRRAGMTLARPGPDRLPAWRPGPRPSLHEAPQLTQPIGCHIVAINRLLLTGGPMDLEPRVHDRDARGTGRGADRVRPHLADLRTARARSAAHPRRVHARTRRRGHPADGGRKRFRPAARGRPQHARGAAVPGRPGRDWNGPLAAMQNHLDGPARGAQHHPTSRNRRTSWTHQ